MNPDPDRLTMWKVVCDGIGSEHYLDNSGVTKSIYRIQRKHGDTVVLYPAVTANADAECRINLGASPFRYPPWEEKRQVAAASAGLAQAEEDEEALAPIECGEEVPWPTTPEDAAYRLGFSILHRVREALHAADPGPAGDPARRRLQALPLVSRVAPMAFCLLSFFRDPSRGNFNPAGHPRLCSPSNRLERLRQSAEEVMGFLQDVSTHVSRKVGRGVSLETPVIQRIATPAPYPEGKNPLYLGAPFPMPFLSNAVSVGAKLKTEIDFGPRIQWLSVAFDPGSCSCQPEDSLSLYPNHDYTRRLFHPFSGTCAGAGPNQKQSWPSQPVVVAGGALTFDFVAAANYAKANPNPRKPDPELLTPTPRPPTTHAGASPLPLQHIRKCLNQREETFSGDSNRRLRCTWEGSQLNSATSHATLQRASQRLQHQSRRCSNGGFSPPVGMKRRRSARRIGAFCGTSWRDKGRVLRVRSLCGSRPNLNQSDARAV